jgi:ribonuclease P protein component
LRVAASRKRWVAPGLILQAYKRKAADPEKAPADAVRLGLTASRKVGSAVERNRARRRLREAARCLLPAAAEPGYDLVLVARAATLRRPFAALVEDLRTALERLHVARGQAGDAKA